MTSELIWILIIKHKLVIVKKALHMVNDLLKSATALSKIIPR